MIRVRDRETVQHAESCCSGAHENASLVKYY